MADSDNLKVYDRVMMHPQWIEDRIKFLGRDAVEETDITMAGMILAMDKDENGTTLNLRILWDDGTSELVSPCNLLKISKDRSAFDWRKVTEDYTKEKEKDNGNI